LYNVVSNTPRHERDSKSQRLVLKIRYNVFSLYLALHFTDPF